MSKDKIHIHGSIVTYSNVIYKEDDMYVVWSPEFDIACQGETLEEATADLETSVKLYMSHPHAKIPKIDFIAVASKIMQVKEKKDEDCKDCLV